MHPKWAKLNGTVGRMVTQAQYPDGLGLFIHDRVGERVDLEDDAPVPVFVEARRQRSP